jgi:hypothetical protein
MIVRVESPGVSAPVVQAAAALGLSSVAQAMTLEDNATANSKVRIATFYTTCSEAHNSGGGGT